MMKPVSLFVLMSIICTSLNGYASSENLKFQEKCRLILTKKLEGGYSPTEQEWRDIHFTDDLMEKALSSSPVFVLLKYDSLDALQLDDIQNALLMKQIEIMDTLNNTVNGSTSLLVKISDISQTYLIKELSKESNEARVVGTGRDDSRLEFWQLLQTYL